MKMESPVHAPCDGVVKALSATPGQAVGAGALLAVLGPD